jgi:hypothetical protein
VLCERNASALSGNRVSVPFCPAQWWVKFKVKRNMSRYISSEISGYIEYYGAKQNRQCLESGMEGEYGMFLGRLLCVDTVELAYCNVLL